MIELTHIRADWAEQVAFNALPASIASDWYSHQYVQQENQPWSRNLTDGSAMWVDVNSYSNVFGLEPNYVSRIRVLISSII